MLSLELLLDRQRQRRDRMQCQGMEHLRDGDIAVFELYYQEFTGHKWRDASVDVGQLRRRIVGCQYRYWVDLAGLAAFIWQNERKRMPDAH